MMAVDKGLSLIQVNLKHCKAATDLLCQRFLCFSSYLALISEPYYHRGKLQRLESQGNLIFQGSQVGTPRTCIVAKGVDFMFLPQLSSSDLTVGLLETEINSVKTKIVVGSVYMPGDSSDLPPSRAVENLLDWCEQMRLPLLLGGDFNAKNILWGSSCNDRRGDSIEVFLAQHNLEILNRGSAPTFDNGRHCSVIDVTVASQAIVGAISGWKVSTDLTLSDHKYIEFAIFGVAEMVYSYRNHKATNWGYYCKLLQDQIGGRIASLRCADDIEKEVAILTSAMCFAFETACPVRKRKHRRNLPWWNLEIKEARNRAHLARLRALRSKCPQDWETFKGLRRELQSLMRKSKTENWQNFCGNVEGAHASSRLQKTLRRDNICKDIGMLKRPDGSYTSTKEEVLDHLFETHFPGGMAAHSCRTAARLDRRMPSRNTEYVNSIITINKVTWAISTFEPYKSAGPDCIFPMLLQQGKTIVAPILCRIFKACIKLAYVPAAWRHAKVTFIPKPGKPVYDVAKNFRPICLSSFLLKVLERIMDYEIKYVIRNSRNFHPNQHAYTAGRSTESALHDVVSVIEKAVYGRKYCLGVFLDIQGAFDNAPFKGILRSLKSFEVHNALVDMVEQLLLTRTVSCGLGGTEAVRLVTRGCPQGGVLSPLLWNVLVDELLKLMDETNVYCQFYADDGTLLFSSATLPRLCTSMQRGLKVVERWCRQNNMSVNPSKTEMVLFTRKRKMDGFRAPRIFGEELKLSDSVKYLGITIDKKLTWKPNVDERCSKATAALFLCRKAVGTTWGLQPKVVIWIYESIIKPMVMYGSVVWWHRASCDYLKRRLTRLQRLACVMITGCFKTTPTAALEAFLNILPLHMAVEVEALASYRRLRRNSVWIYEEGHQHISNLSDQIPEMEMPEDRIGKVIRFSNKFTINIQTCAESIAAHDHLVAVRQPEITSCYTDGSRTESTGLSGTGFFVTNDDKKFSASLGKYATVFQSEVFAIKECAEYLNMLDLRDKSISIFSDSQAALKALSRYEVKSSLVLSCIQALESLSGNNIVTLSWIPGHHGVEGNEVADELARAGSSLPPVGPEPVIGVSQAAVKRSVKSYYSEKFERYWKNLPTCRASRLCLRAPNRTIAKHVSGCSRGIIRALFGIFTGHNSLNAHLHRIGIVDSPLCRKCEEEDETSVHVLCRCPALNQLRFQIFDYYSLEPEDLVRFPFGKLQKFCILAELWTEVRGETR
jgi:ribonuclease HI